MKLVWDESAWNDYTWWQVQDRKVLKRMNALIKGIARNANEGLGKPEPLKYGFQGYWSRRMTDEHRLICKVVQDEIRIAQCRYHYEDQARRASGPRLLLIRPPSAAVPLPIGWRWPGRRVGRFVPRSARASTRS